MVSIDKIKKYIDTNLSEKRRIHTYGVYDTAIMLAEKYGADVKKAEIAALLHDIYRGVSDKVLNYHVKHLGLDEKYIDNKNLSHGKIAAAMLPRDFDIDDEDIINAVSFHTTGRSHMSLLEKIIYLADAIEPGRSYPGVEQLREVAAKDLDKACLQSLKRTIDYVTSQGHYLDGDTEKAVGYFEELINKKEKSHDK